MLLNAAKGVVQFDTDAVTSGITVASGIAKLATSGVAANTYGSTSAVPVIAVDAFGRIITATTTTNIAIAASQVTSGVLDVARGGTGVGTMTANRIPIANGTGTAFLYDSCTIGQTIEYNGTTWICKASSSMGVANAYVQSGNAFGAKAVLGTTDNNDLEFITNNTAKMTIKANGNVGIGTTAPSSVLHTVGTTNAPDATGSAADGAFRIGDSGTTAIMDMGLNGPGLTYGWIQTRSPSNYATSYHLALQPNGGNVGIGTTAPGAKLDVKGDFAISGSTSGAVKFAVPAAAGSATYTWPAAAPGSNMVLQSDSSGVLSWVSAGGGGSPAGSTGYLQFNNGGSFGADSGLFWDNSTKRLGVGTVSPTAPLHVEKAVSGSLVKLNNTQAWTGAGEYTLDVAGYTNLGGFRVNGADPVNSFYASNTNVGFTVDSGRAMVFGHWNGSSKDEALRVHTNGYVSIGGNTNPQANLSVTGGVNVDSGLINITNTSGGGVTAKSFGTSGVPSFDLWRGRGTPTASQSLQTGDTLGKLNFYGQNDSSSASSAASIYATATQNYSSGNHGASLSFYTSTGGFGTTRMTIMAGGNVGIGTTSATAKLDVKGDFAISGATSGAVKFAVPAAAGSATYTWPAAAPASDMVLQSDASGNLSWVAGGGDLKKDGSVTMNVLSQFKLADGNSGTPSITFGSDTNTGFYKAASDNIGITAGGAVMGYIGPSNVSLAVPLIAYNHLMVSDLGKYAGMQKRGGFGEDLAFYIDTVEAVTIKNTSGNVGIGNTNPGYKLAVAGDVSIATGNALRFNATSVCTSAGCTSSSDERLKENILPLQDSLNKVLQLQGVHYDYKDKKEYTDKHQIGVIAQQVEKVYPEVVITDSKTGLKSVAYDHLVAPLIEAVKSIYGRVVGVERQVASVQDDLMAKDAKIKQLEEQNAAMKAYLCAKDPEASICK